MSAISIGSYFTFYRTLVYWINNNMKIFLTEIEAYGTTFAGPNIVASSFEVAELAAAQNNLVVVGELDSIYVDKDSEKHLNTIPKTNERLVH